MANDPSSSVNVTGITDAQLAAMQQAGLLGGQSGLGVPAPSVDEMKYATQVASPQYQTNYPTPAPNPSVLDSLPTLDEAANYLANLPAQAQRLLTNPAAFTEMLTGKNPLPEQAGFAASATGLPAQNPNSLFTPAGMAYNKGYESGEPVSIAAMGVPALAPAGRFLGSAAGERIMAGQSLIPGVPADLVNPQILSAVKNKGGNWLSNGLDSLDWLKKPIESVGESRFDSAWDNGNPQKIAHHISEMEKIGYAPEQIKDFMDSVAVNNWVDKKLKNYVRNEMGTPNDPVLQLHDQGITHLPNQGEVNPNYFPALENTKIQRAAAGMPVQGFANTPLGRNWENLADEAIRNKTAGMYVKQGESPSAYGMSIRHLENNPWLKTVDPKTPVHATSGFINDTGIGHIVDELKNSIDPRSGLPQHLRLKPETLDKMTVPHAVKHVAKINKYRAEQMEKAAKDSLKDFPIVHETGKGYNIHELKLPEVPKELPEGYKVEPHPKESPYQTAFFRVVSPTGEHIKYGATPEEAIHNFNNYGVNSPRERLDKALKNEGEQMGHCVGGYTDSVASGHSRIFSLRDANGGAHATIEATPSRQTYNPALIPDDVKAQIDKKAHDETVKAGYPKDSMGWLHHYTGVQIQEGEKYFKNNPLINIQQIKGKGNGAVSDKYRTYIKDWLNKEAGKIGEVQDLENVGLFRGTSVLNDSLHKGGTFKNIVNQQRPNSVLPNEEFSKQFGKKFYSSPEELAQDVIKYLDSKKPFAKTPEQMREELFAKSRADQAAQRANEPRTLQQRMRDQGLLPPEGHKNGGRIQKFAEGGTPEPIDSNAQMHYAQTGMPEITGNPSDVAHTQTMLSDVSHTNIADPNYTLGVHEIRAGAEMPNETTAGYFVGTNPGVVNLRTLYTDPWEHANRLGHEAQHSQEYDADTRVMNDWDKRTFPEKVLSHSKEINADRYKSQIEANYQKYKDEYLKKNSWNQTPDNVLGAYFNNQSIGFDERLADLAGLEAKLNRGERLVDTELGKAVLNTPELSNYYYQSVRPLEPKAIAYEPSMLERIGTAARNFNEKTKAGESYADALYHSAKNFKNGGSVKIPSIDEMRLTLIRNK